MIGVDRSRSNRGTIMGWLEFLMSYAEQSQEVSSPRMVNLKDIFRGYLISIWLVTIQVVVFSNLFTATPRTLALTLAVEF
jgi:hypothetical protein